MKGITNATKGAADVVQDATKVSVLGANIQEATDSQPGLMSKADHAVLSTTGSRIGTCYNNVSIDGQILRFSTVDGSTLDIEIPRKATSFFLVSPGPLDDPATTYTLMQGDTAVASGSMWDERMTFNLFSGKEYTLTINAYDDTLTYTFTPDDSSSDIDLTSCFCKLSVNAQGGYDLKDLSVRGHVVNSATAYSPVHSFYVIKSSKSAIVKGTVNFTGEIPQLSGVSLGPIYSVIFSTDSLSPSSDTVSATLLMSKKGIKYTITSGGTLVVPSATYRILCVGGGGGGGVSQQDGRGGGGGGGSGYVKATKTSLNGSYTISIGAGGAGGRYEDGEIVGAKSGGPTSFGTVVSAKGGEGGFSNNGSNSGGDGGSGGSGGGGGGGYSSSGYISGGDGGSGDWGGGGGGGAAGSNNSSSPGTAGKGGTSAIGDGGYPGNTSSSISDGDRVYGGSGSSGTKLTGYEDLYLYAANGGDGGDIYSGYSKRYNSYNMQGLGGSGGDSPLGSGGKPKRVDNSNSRYYDTGASSGYGSGGCGGCYRHTWVGGYGSSDGSGGKPGAIVLMYESD